MKTHQYAWRILARMRSYSLISLTGLVISLTGTIIIARYVHQELTVDHSIPTLDRTFLLTEQLHQRIRLTSNKDWNKDPNYIDPLNNPKVECYTKFIMLDDGEVNYKNKGIKARIIPTDTLFLDILPRKVLAGSGKLSSPTDAIITRSFAQRLFGNENPIGQTLKLANKLVTVTGVIHTPTTKSIINYDMLVSIDLNEMWNRIEYNIVRLYSEQDAAKLNAQQKPIELIKNNMIPSLYQLFPLNKFYFNENIPFYHGTDMIKKGNIRNVWILILVAVMLLAIGIFNYLNIYTVMMLKRSREFGIKKVYGAGYWQIFKQIYLENFYLSAISLFFAWLLIEVTGGLLTNELDIPILSNKTFDISLSAGILFIFPFIMSLFPTIRYTHAAPITSIRSVRLGGHSMLSRTVFLFMQYIITICLIIIAIYFMKQLHFMLHADIGYHITDIIKCDIYPDDHRDQIIHSDEEWERESAKEKHTISSIIHQMNACPLFEQWTFGDSFQQLKASLNIKKADSNQEFQQVAFADFSNDMMDIFGIELVEGKRWNDSTDVFAQYKLIINETAKRMFDIKDIRHDLLQPESRIWWSMGIDESKNPPFEVVGVIKDFNTNHLSKGVLPIISIYSSGKSDRIPRGVPIIARIVPGKQQEAIQFLTKLHAELLGDGELNYSFIEDEVTAMYENDRRTSKIYITFAILAILVSCLGLLGLSLFDIRQRYREIALRKVNGATMKDIIPLVIKKYLYVMGWAIVIAIPLSYLMIQKYMEDFANRTPLSWWIYVLAIILILLITLATLFWQVYKAIGIEPARIMKSE